MRAFLAVTVAEPALAPLLELRSTLAAAVPGVKWARPDGLHVTLRFFEDLDPAAVEPLMSKVAAAVVGTAPFDLELSGLGTFPANTRHARVLWLGIATGAERLTALFAGVDESVERAGLGREDRPYSPHCTLGRPKQPWHHVDEWDSVVAAGATLPPFTVRAVDLYESRDGYHVIATARLHP